MSTAVILFLVILFLAFLLFTTELFPLEISALGVLVLLVLFEIISAREAFESFGNESIILIGSLFVLVGGLRRTGLITSLESHLLRVSKGSRSLSFLLVLLLVAFFSAFVSNTATLAISIPIVVSISKRFGDSPRQWLLPVGFASLLGGMNTLIGTSTNIIISGILPEYGLEPFSLFTTSSVGFPILVCGIIYLMVLSRFVLKKEEDGENQNLGVKYDLRSYTSELTIEAGSSICNQTLAASPLSREMHLNVLGVLRGDNPVLVPRSTLQLQEGDRLVVEGNLQEINEVLQKYKLKFEDERNVQIETDEEDSNAKKKKRNVDLALHEVLVSSRSLLVGRTPREAYLRNRRRLSLIAINRQGVTLRKDLSDVRIAPGDILVVQFLDNIDNQTLDNLGLIPLQERTQQRYRTELAPVAAFIFIFSLLIGSVSQYPIALFTLAGAVAVVVCGVLRSDEIYQTIEWRVLIFIGAILCLGKGMDASGTAELLGNYVANSFHQFGPQYIIAFFFLLTFVLTQLLSNQATAVVMVPVAIQTATTLGYEPMGIIIAVAVAASCAFMTPFEPALMLVYGAGSYKFSDFAKLGMLLGVLAFLISLTVIPTIWAL